MNVASKISGKFQEFFGPNYSTFRANPGSNFRVVQRFSGIHRALDEL